MKLKKILAFTCSLVMVVSMIASTALVADAAIDGYNVTLNFVGYETKGTATFAKINVDLEVPDTLSAYTMTPADWETTFEDSYTGFALQGMAVEIPDVAGLTFVGSLSKVNEPVSITDGATSVKLVYANTGDPSTYYAGELNKTIATLYYRITGDVAGTYEMTATDIVVKYYNWTGSSKPAIIERTFGDFKLTNAIVKPEVSEPTVEWLPITAEVVEFVGEDPSNVDYAYGINTTCAGAVQMIFAADADEARQYSKEIAVDGATGAVNVGFVSAEKLANVGVLFRDADTKDATTKIWYSLDVDNKAE